MIKNQSKFRVHTFDARSFSVPVGILIVLCVASLLWIVFLLVHIEGSPVVRRSKDSLPLIVAICGLIGTAWTGIISSIGIGLKQSMDERTAALQREAEVRLRTESAMKAVELMTAPNLDHAAAKERRQGSIVALASIGQTDFALSILEEYVAQDLVGISFATRVIDQTLKGNDDVAKTYAAGILESISEKLPNPEGSYWFPDSVKLKWNLSLSSDARGWVVEALVKCLLARPKK